MPDGPFSVDSTKIDSDEGEPGIEPAGGVLARGVVVVVGLVVLLTDCSFADPERFAVYRVSAVTCKAFTMYRQ
jgi:hypothetical protein